MTSSKLAPGATIGIIGGGQLGKMMAQSALRMGYRVTVLDPSADAPAAATSHHFINADFSDIDALKSLSGMSDVITYEFENINAEILHTLVDDYNVPQGAETVLTLQNRESEKEAIRNSGAQIVPYEKVDSTEAIRTFIEAYGAPVIVKTATGGYDGKGQYLIEAASDLETLQIPYDETEFVAEKYLDLEREVSLTVARSVSGQVIYFPLQENLHKDQVLYRTIVPSRMDYTEQTQKEARKIMEALHFVGAFTIEFFVAKDGSLYVNEIAPRPHNSGHYSIEACNISQFDAHVLSILDHRMPEVYLHQNAVMMNLLGADLDRLDGELFTHPDWNIHIYGKTDRKPARKMGHVTVLTDNLEHTIRTLNRDFVKEAD